MRCPILLSCLCFALAAQASSVHAQEPAAPDESAEQQPRNPARAERHEQALRRQLPASQLRQLEAGDDAYLGLFMAAAQPRPRGGVLLIADRDEHADWPELIGPARRQLSVLGWHTLAISLPNTAPADPSLGDAARTELMAEKAERATRRINVAAQALHAEGAERLVVLGRGEGAFWALHATATDTRPSVDADALILSQARPPIEADGGDARLDTLLAQWKEPVYEIFVGSGESNQQRAQEHKLNARRQGNGLYHQLVLPKQDQSDLGQQMLVKRLHGWLEKTVVQ